MAVIDCSKRNALIKEGPVDIQLEIEVNKPFPPKTIAYCLLVHDCLFEYTPLTNTMHKII
jgi:hypothetical protein